jgi:glycerol-3-phosphate O-acyltransferase
MTAENDSTERSGLPMTALSADQAAPLALPAVSAGAPMLTPTAATPVVSSRSGLRDLWYRFVRACARPFLRVKSVTPDPNRLPFDPSKPVLYLIENHGLSNLLILDRACEEAGWPRPIERLPLKLARGRQRACFSLHKRSGMWLGKSRLSDRSERLKDLLTLLNLERGSEVQLVPVSIFLGRAPDRTSGWFKVLFSENWVAVGRLRRFLGVLFNGRGAMVRVSEPVDLKQSLAGPVNLDAGARKLARVLRVHFRRIRTMVVGPDFSHRRIMTDSVLYSPAVRAAIAATAAKEKIPLATAYRRAKKILWEIAADYSHSVVRSLYIILSRFWNRVYSGVQMHHFDAFAKTVPGKEVVYVPCHRSHIDYILLSYLLYSRGHVVPHIAAGVNLNLPVVGSILRRGGAFFMRRSFKANPLYTEIFREYMAELVAQGFALEYFIEGGRSRTGRMLTPKAGLLAMTIRSFLRERRRPVLFQPVYIGYEKLIEGKSYLGELSGKPKKKESLFGLIRSSIGILKQRYGQVTVNFGESIDLGELLDRHSTDWRSLPLEEDQKPAWLPAAIEELAQQIAININRAADVNPICLLALGLLGTPKQAIGEADLQRVMSLSQRLLLDAPYSQHVTVTDRLPADMIEHGIEMRWIRRIKHPLGDVLAVDTDEAILLSYYRNNVLHLFAAVSWVACCFLNTRRLTHANVVNLGKQVYPFLKAELFLPWSADEFGDRISQTIHFLIKEELLSSDEPGNWLSRAADADAAFQLRILAHGLLQTFQRYYVVITALTRNGSGTLSAGELENLCHLTAQRISLLHELSGPEFFDKSLFRGFIQMLREGGFVSSDENSKLVFGTELERLGSDSKVVLSRELRQSIIKITPEVKAQLPDGEGQSPKALPAPESPAD